METGTRNGASLWNCSEVCRTTGRPERGDASHGVVIEHYAGDVVPEDLLRDWLSAARESREGLGVIREWPQANGTF